MWLNAIVAAACATVAVAHGIAKGGAHACSPSTTCADWLYDEHLKSANWSSNATDFDAVAKYTQETVDAAGNCKFGHTAENAPYGRNCEELLSKRQKSRCNAAIVFTCRCVDSAEAAETLQWYKAENKRIGWLWWDIGLGIFVAIPMLAVGTIFMAKDEDNSAQNGQNPRAVEEGNVEGGGGREGGEAYKIWLASFYADTGGNVEEGNVVNNSGEREAENQTKESVHVEPDAEKATNDGAARDQRSNKERLEQAVCVHVVKAKDACCSKYAPEVIRSPWFKYTAWLVSGVAMSGGLYYLAHGLGSISVYSAGCDSKQPDISSSMLGRRDQPYYDANRLSNFGNSVNSTSGEQKSLNFDVPAEQRKNRFLFAFAVLMPIFVCYGGVKVGDKAQETGEAGSSDKSYLEVVGDYFAQSTKLHRQMIKLGEMPAAAEAEQKALEGRLNALSEAADAGVAKKAALTKELQKLREAASQELQDDERAHEERLAEVKRKQAALEARLNEMAAELKSSAALQLEKQKEEAAALKSRTEQFEQQMKNVDGTFPRWEQQAGLIVLPLLARCFPHLSELFHAHEERLKEVSLEVKQKQEALEAWLDEKAAELEEKSRLVTDCINGHSSSEDDNASTLNDEVEKQPGGGEIKQSETNVNQGLELPPLKRNGNEEKQLENIVKETCEEKDDSSSPKKFATGNLNQNVELSKLNGGSSGEDKGDHKHADILPVVHRFHSRVNTSQIDNIIN